MRFVTEDEMQERDDKLRAEWRAELRRALEAMRGGKTFPLETLRLSDITAALATLPQQPQPQQPVDPLSPAAFVGHTTPDGKPVRWVAWDRHGCCEYSTTDEPKRNDHGFLIGNPCLGYNSRPDLDDPARAGQTLWVGQGPDPRERDQLKPTSNGELADRARGVARCLSYNGNKHEAAAKHLLREMAHRLDRPLTLADIPAASADAADRRPIGWCCEWEPENFRGRFSLYAVKQDHPEALPGFVRQFPIYAEPLTIADIPAELRAEIEAAERERVAQWFDVDKWEWEAGRVRALGPREVKP